MDSTNQLVSNLMQRVCAYGVPMQASKKSNSIRANITVGTYLRARKINSVLEEVNYFMLKRVFVEQLKQVFRKEMPHCRA